MVEALLIASLGVGIGVFIVAMILLRRSAGSSIAPIESRLAGIESVQERTERSVREEIGRNREEAGRQAGRLREEIGTSSARTAETLVKSIGEISSVQKTQLETFAVRLNDLTASNEKSSETLRATVDERLRLLQEDNAKKLDLMRQTVDEKLQGTLEKRLGESFKQVTERLEQVHRGLGEMQTLAAGVGDLKKVLSNVKTRGTLAEVQLGSLLEQILAPEQYASNVETRRGSNQRVEFAVKLPGRDSEGNSAVWLPIDAKFPIEDYQRLVDAQERADAEQAEAAAKQLEVRIKGAAKDIRDKYLDPPATTDFGIMFLGTEGLYAEVLRRTGLFEQLQGEFRVIVTGPTTVAALLNSLQMGFRTLVIQKRASEVWSILGAVKSEFGKFGELLDGVSKKLQEAQNKIEDATRKTRTIERRLQGVQELPPESSDAPMLPVDEASGDSL